MCVSRPDYSTCILRLLIQSLNRNPLPSPNTLGLMRKYFLGKAGLFPESLGACLRAFLQLCGSPPTEASAGCKIHSKVTSPSNFKCHKCRGNWNVKKRKPSTWFFLHSIKRFCNHWRPPGTLIFAFVMKYHKRFYFKRFRWNILLEQAPTINTVFFMCFFHVQVHICISNKMFFF